MPEHVHDNQAIRTYSPVARKPSITVSYRGHTYPALGGNRAGRAKAVIMFKSKAGAWSVLGCRSDADKAIAEAKRYQAQATTLGNPWGCADADVILVTELEA